jgi:anthranilate phosphoribosyltransferase
MPEVEKTESEAASLVDVDSPHVSSVKSDFEDQAIKTRTQATRKEHEAEDNAEEYARKASDAASEAKKKAGVKGKEAKEKAKASSKKLQDNRDNPVVMGNVVIVTVGAIALAAGAYQKHQEGKLDWQLAGTVAGVVGVLGVADYFASK